MSSADVKHITFYFDFISPYAFLAFEKLPQMLAGQSYRVSYKPVLFAALLKHHGQLGPAEIAGKREWTYRQVMWLADQQGTRLTMPQTHPFNPLGLLRLALACAGQNPDGSTGTPSRFVVETIFHHVWQSGLDAADGARLVALAARLQPPLDLAEAQVKERLQVSTTNAIADGVFGVPSYRIDDKLFWGLDALPMLRGYMGQEPWFVSPAWQTASNVTIGKTRI